MSTTLKTFQTPNDLPVNFIESCQARKIFNEKCQTLFHLSCHPLNPLHLAMKFLSIKALEGKIITLFVNSLWRGYTPARKGLNFKFSLINYFVCLFFHKIKPEKWYLNLRFKLVAKRVREFTLALTIPPCAATKIAIVCILVIIIFWAKLNWNLFEFPRNFPN